MYDLWKTPNILRAFPLICEFLAEDCADLIEIIVLTSRLAS